MGKREEMTTKPGDSQAGYQLERDARNPILTPADFPGADVVFNCGQVQAGNETILFVSVIHRSGHYRGIKGATTHVARSRDGIRFEIDPVPFLQKPETYPLSEIDHHPIDTRVTPIDGWYYIVHPGCGPWGTLAILGRTKDFGSYEFIDIISLPDNRGVSLFPEKIGADYIRLDRPYRVAPNEHHTDGNIWIARSPDLVHWGHFRPLLRPGFSSWAVTKIGPTPPIRTDRGWLTIIHGVSQSCAGYRYALGAMLLDLEDPARVIGLTRSYILAPEMQYERLGSVPNVVFACGAIADEGEDRIRVYYGGADTCICLATGSLSGLVDACLCDE